MKENIKMKIREAFKYLEQNHKVLNVENKKMVGLSYTPDDLNKQFHIIIVDVVNDTKHYTDINISKERTVFSTLVFSGILGVDYSSIGYDECHDIEELIRYFPGNIKSINFKVINTNTNFKGAISLVEKRLSYLLKDIFKDELPNPDHKNGDSKELLFRNKAIQLITELNSEAI